MCFPTVMLFRGRKGKGYSTRLLTFIDSGSFNQVQIPRVLGIQNLESRNNSFYCCCLLLCGDLARDQYFSFDERATNLKCLGWAFGGKNFAVHQIACSRRSEVEWGRATKRCWGYKEISLRGCCELQKCTKKCEWAEGLAYCPTQDMNQCQTCVILHTSQTCCDLNGKPLGTWL